MVASIPTFAVVGTTPGTGPVAGCNYGFDVFAVGSRTIWNPVKNLDIGVEVIYVRNDDNRQHFDANRGYPFLAHQDSEWLSRLKISRAF